MPPSDSDLSALAMMVRRHDHDRFAAAMFAPPDMREDLFALYAVNIELSQIRISVREAMAGMIRLQWWREVVDGRRDSEAAGNPVSARFLDVLRRRQLPLTSVQAMIDARENDLSSVPFETVSDLEAYAENCAGRLTSLAALTLGGDECGAVDAGAGFAMIGLLRSHHFHQAQGWNTLPAQSEERAGADLVLHVCDRAEFRLNRAAKADRSRASRSALLPVISARAYLHEIRAAKGDLSDMRVFRPRPMPLRLLWGALSGRI